MKRIGIAAAILLVALLMTGVVNALDTATASDGQIIHVRTIKVDNVTQSGDHWTVTGKPENITLKHTGTSPDTLVTSAGQIYNFTFHSVSNESGINSVTNPDEKEVTVEKAGPGLIKVGSQIYKLNYVVNTEAQNGNYGSVAPGDSYAYGPYSWSAGTQVSVSATWTPTNQNVYLGILDLVQDKGKMVLVSGGSGTYSTSVPWSSNEWGKFILNPYGNTATVYYTIS